MLLKNENIKTLFRRTKRRIEPSWPGADDNYIVHWLASDVSA